MIIIGVDGSEASVEAARAGLAVLDPTEELLVVVAVPPGDPSLVTGSGMAGGVMTEEDFQAGEKAAEAAGQSAARESAQALGIPEGQTLVVRGDPGVSLCVLAQDRAAKAIVIGSRGRGGIKRAFLGSVSDHVVRNAPCPVVVTNPKA